MTQPSRGVERREGVSVLRVLIGKKRYNESLNSRGLA